MLDAAMHSAESGEQSRPSIVAAFQHLFTVAVGALLQLFLQGGDGVIVVIERIAEVKQVAFFGGKQENQPHHDGERAVIEGGLVHALQQRAMAFLVEGIEGSAPALRRLRAPGSQAGR